MTQTDSNIAGINEPRRLTLLWSAKEAMKKSLLRDQPSIFQGFRLIGVKDGAWFTLRLRYEGPVQTDIDVACRFLDDAVLAYTATEAPCA